MRKLVNLLFLFLSFTFAVSSCSSDDYDDTFIKSEIAGIKNDIEALKKQVTSIEALVGASEEGKVITQIQEMDNGKGYKIVFSDATAIEVLRAGNTSAVGIMEEGGVYYWTLNTNGKANFILNAQGDKLPVADKDNKTSSLQIDADGYWTVDGRRMKDENEDWVRFTKGSGDAFFTEITETEETVVFTMEDGTTLVIAKAQGTFLYFDVEDPATVVILKENEEKSFEFNVSSSIRTLELISEISPSWTVELDRTAGVVKVIAPKNPVEGVQDIRLQGLDKNGAAYVAFVKVGMKVINYADPKGTFLLNEGNMGSDNGSLIYIDAEGEIYESVYKTVNGRELGNVSQSMTIADGKIFIIAQNGQKAGTDNEGKLVIADSKSLKRIASFQNELDVISRPTQVSAFDMKSVYIRDSKGIYIFDANTPQRAPRFVSETEGAASMPMITLGERLFAAQNSTLIAIDRLRTTITKSADMGGKITGIAKTTDGNIWVSTSNKIMKVDAQTLAIIKSNEVTVGSVSAGWGNTSAITAYGELIHYSGASTKLYEHNFATGESKLIGDVKPMLQNSLIYSNTAIHPVTGRVFVPAISDFGTFKINSIGIFDCTSGQPTLVKEYNDYSRFPGGFFFPANFN